MIFYFPAWRCPKETFDAARIEGAGHLRMMLRVALPQLRPVTAVVVMLTLFKSLKAFDLIAVMTKRAGSVAPTSSAISSISRASELALWLRRNRQRRYSCSLDRRRGVAARQGVRGAFDV